MTVPWVLQKSCSFFRVPKSPISDSCLVPKSLPTNDCSLIQNIDHINPQKMNHTKRIWTTSLICCLVMDFKHFKLSDILIWSLSQVRISSDLGQPLGCLLGAVLIFPSIAVYWIFMKFPSEPFTPAITSLMMSQRISCKSSWSLKER